MVGVRGGVSTYLGLARVSAFVVVSATGLQSWSATTTTEKCKSGEQAALTRLTQLHERSALQFAGALPKWTWKAVESDYLLAQNRVPVRDDAESVWQKYLRGMQSQAMKVLDEIRQNPPVLECRPARDPQCGDGAVDAYVLFFANRPFRRIYFCESFFALSQRAQAEIFFHEMTHVSLSTEDHGLDWIKRGTSLDLERAKEDAYHWQAFAAAPETPEKVFRNHVWPWLSEPNKMVFAAVLSSELHIQE